MKKLDVVTPYQAPPSKQQRHHVEEIWEEYFDNHYNVPYFFNKDSNTSVWETPTGPNIRIVKGIEEDNEPSRSRYSHHSQQQPYHQHHASTSKSFDPPPPSTSSSSSSSRPAPTTTTGTTTTTGPPRLGDVLLGTVANVKQGYGFVNSPSYFNNRTDLYFRFEELLDATYLPKIGDEVEFEIGHNSSQKLIAIRVRRLPPTTSSSSSSSAAAARRSPPHRKRQAIRSPSPPPSSSSRQQQHQPPPPPPSSSTSTWIQYTDKKTNLPYWHCPASDETTWEKPVDF